MSYSYSTSLYNAQGSGLDSRSNLQFVMGPNNRFNEFLPIPTAAE
uniref:ORF44j n=1 Tax=Pinus koraiensis TaxID=88728 RepID=A4QM84_PINKO|nr:ORF44j [Pinus koraiensis]